MGPHINVTNPTGGFLFGPWFSTATFLDPVLGSRYIHRCSLFAQLDPLCCSCFDFSVWASSNVLYICAEMLRETIFCAGRKTKVTALLKSDGHQIYEAAHVLHPALHSAPPPVSTFRLKNPPYLSLSLSQRKKLHPSGDNFILVLLVRPRLD